MVRLKGYSKDLPSEARGPSGGLETRCWNGDCRTHRARRSFREMPDSAAAFSYVVYSRILFLRPNTKYSLSKNFSRAAMKWGFRYRFAFLVGLVALTFAGGAFAQSSDQPEPVPRELAAALIGSGFGGESTDFFVGTLPSGLPDDFTLPEGAQVLGGVSTDGFGFPRNPFGSSSPPERRIIVADVPSRSSSVKARHDSTLVGRGWSRMTSVPPNQQVCQRRQSSSTALFCREDTVLRRFISYLAREMKERGSRLSTGRVAPCPASAIARNPQLD